MTPATIDPSLARREIGGSSSITAQLISLGQWQEFVESRPESTPFHHSQWLGLLHEQYGFPILIPAIVCGGSIAAALPFAQTPSGFGHSKLLALPFTDAISILAVDSPSAYALHDSIKELLVPRCRMVCQRADCTDATNTREFGWYRHEIDTGSNSELFQGSNFQNVRCNLRRAERRGLDYAARTDREALELFYGLHTQSRRRLGVPVQPRSYFDCLYRRLIQPGLGSIGVVSTQGRVIAAAVLLSYHQTLLLKYSASDFSAWEYRPNDFLIGNVLRRAVEEGMHCLDLGITPIHQAGLLRFKRKWGGRETAVGFECYGNQVNQSSEPSRLLKCASPLIRSLPTLVCRAIGEVFYKYGT